MAEGDGVAGSQHIEFVQVLAPCMTYDGGDASDYQYAISVLLRPSRRAILGEDTSHCHRAIGECRDDGARLFRRIPLIHRDSA